LQNRPIQKVSPEVIDALYKYAPIKVLARHYVEGGVHRLLPKREGGDLGK
jgi:hypothetical protein